MGGRWLGDAPRRPPLGGPSEACEEGEMGQTLGSDPGIKETELNLGATACLPLASCGGLGKRRLSVPLCKMGMMKVPAAPPPLRVVVGMKGGKNQQCLELSLAGWALHSSFMDK